MKRCVSTLFLLLLGSLMACGSDPSQTQLVVTVDSDLRSPSEIDRVTLDMGAHATAKSGSADLREEPLPRTVGLVHDSGPLGPFVIKATGWLGDQRVVEREVETSFASGKTLKLTITLSSACKDMFCTDGMTCVAGSCEVVERTTGGHGDAGTSDAATSDTGADASADASDGVGATPVCSIDLPAMNDAYQSNARIALSGHCSDAESGTLTEGLIWSSDLSGDIGAGPTDTARLTELGTHTISLCAPDPADSSVTGCTSVEIVVTDTPEPAGSIDPPQQNRSTKQPFTDNAAILLTGSGSGAGVTLSWRDNLQGDLGTGESVSLDSPMIGHHVVTFTVTDRDHNAAAVSQDFVVLSARQSSLVEPFGAANTALGGAVLALASDVNTRVYAGTANKSLYRFDPQNTVLSGTQVVGALEGSVQALHLAPSKALAYLATSGGLSVCDYAGAMGVSSTCKTWMSGDPDTNDMLAVLRMTSSGTDYLLVGTRAGLAIADKVAGGSSGSTSFDASYRLTQREVRGLALATSGGGAGVWLATDAGLSRYNPADDALSTIDTDGMASTSLSDVAEGSDRAVWVASSGGLGRYTPSTRAWTFWASDAGLVSNHVQALAIQHLTLNGDARDVIWMGTDAGVSRFDTSLQSFMSLTTEDGLPSGNVHDVIVLEDGTKVFATEKGVARYTGP